MEMLKISEVIDDYEMHLYNRNLSVDTIDQYISELKYFKDFLYKSNIEYINEVRSRDTEKFIGSLIKRGNKPTTRSRKKTIIENFFKYAKNHNLTEINPTDMLMPIKISDADKKKQEIISSKEKRKIFKAVEKNSRDVEKNKAIIEILLTCALRVNELVNLKWSDIDEENEVMQIQGKGGKNRRIPLFNEVKKVLFDYKKSKKRDPVYIFTSKNSNKPMSERAIHDMIKRYVRLARINKNIGCHSLRRTSTTNYLREGVNVRYIQLFLGHSDISTTTAYMLPEEEEVNRSLKEARKTLNKK